MTDGWSNLLMRSTKGVGWRVVEQLAYLVEHDVSILSGALASRQAR